MRRRLFGLAVVAAGAAAVVLAGTGLAGLAGPGQKTNLQVRVITASPLKAGTWDPAHYNAYSAVAKRQGWKLQIAELVPYGKASEVLERWGEEGVDVVFATDNGFERYLLDAAARYRDTNWVIMSDMSTTRGLRNVGSYGIDSCQQGVLLGAIAGLASRKGVVGVDTTIPILPTKKELAGMRVGISRVAPGTRLVVKYTGDFVDVGKAVEIASALVQEGADVLTAPVSATSIEIAKRAQQEGVPFVGENIDLSRFAPKVTVTSIVLDFTQGYAEVGTQTANGTFQPRIRRLGLKERFFRVLPFRTHKDVERRVRALERDIVSGKVNLRACQNLK
jgi:basic membrane lipoprotein Med (substrate-binding protein (PBP1-ABC) superfamily)